MQNYESPIKGHNFEDLDDNYKAKCRRIALLERYIKRHLINTIGKYEDFYLFSTISPEKTRMDSNSKSENSSFLTIDRRDTDRIDIIIDYDSLNRSEKSTQVLNFYKTISTSTQSNVNFRHSGIQTSIDPKTCFAQITAENQTCITQTDCSYYNTSSKSTQKLVKSVAKSTNTKSLTCNTAELSILELKPQEVEIIQSVRNQKDYRMAEGNEVYEMDFNLKKDDISSLLMHISTLKASIKFLREENNLQIQQIAKSELSTIDLEETLKTFKDSNDTLNEKNSRLKSKLNDYRSRYLHIYALSMKLKALEELVT